MSFVIMDIQYCEYAHMLSRAGRDIMAKYIYILHAIVDVYCRSMYLESILVLRTVYYKRDLAYLSPSFPDRVAYFLFSSCLIYHRISFLIFFLVLSFLLTINHLNL